MHLRAVNVNVVGTKRWFLRPPARSMYSTTPVFEWLHSRYAPGAGVDVEFVQRPGEIVVRGAALYARTPIHFTTTE